MSGTFLKRLNYKNLFKLIKKKESYVSLSAKTTRRSSLFSRCCLSLPTTYVDWRKYPWVVFLNSETTEVAFVHLRRQLILVIHINATCYYNTACVRSNLVWREENILQITTHVLFFSHIFCTTPQSFIFLQRTHLNICHSLCHTSSFTVNELFF